MAGAAVAAALLGCVAFSGKAAATTVVRKTLPDLCREAEYAFVGTVQGIESRWVSRERGTMETLVTFGDLTWIVGSGPEQVTLRFGGGRIGDLREVISGLPQFTEGERVAIFGRAGVAVSPIVGFNQGWFRIVPDGDGAVVLGGDGRPVTAVRRDALVTGVDGNRHDALAVDAFVREVREQCARWRRVRRRAADVPLR